MLLRKTGDNVMGQQQDRLKCKFKQVLNTCDADHLFEVDVPHIHTKAPAERVPEMRQPTQSKACTNRRTKGMIIRQHKVKVKRRVVFGKRMCSHRVTFESRKAATDLM
eukprot:3853790-Amphidinium_carterae.1